MQPDDLAAAQSEQCDEVEQRVEPVFADAVEEGGGVFGCPHRDPGSFSDGCRVEWRFATTGSYPRRFWVRASDRSRS
jgi:hypothetical protein